jgi:hypothetical protein
MKKYLFLVLVVLVFGYMVYQVFASGDKPLEKQVVNHSIPMVQKTEVRNVTKPTLSVEPKQFKEEKKSVDEALEVSEKEVAIVDNSVKTVQESDMPTLKPEVEPLEPVVLEEKLLDDLVVGDVIRIPLENEQYDIEIKSKLSHANGDISFTGMFQYENQSYDALITKGSTYSFMTLNTPKGSREVELKGDKGWVYDSATLKNTYIDYEKSDTIEVE